MVSSPYRLVAWNYCEWKKFVVDENRVIEDDAVGTSILHSKVHVDREPVVAYLRSILLAFNQVHRLCTVLKPYKLTNIHVVTIDVPRQTTS